MDKDLLQQYKALDSPEFKSSKNDSDSLKVAQKQANWLFNFLNPETH